MNTFLSSHARWMWGYINFLIIVGFLFLRKSVLIVYYFPFCREIWVYLEVKSCFFFFFFWLSLAMKHRLASNRSTLPASVSKMLRLQMYTTIPSRNFLILKNALLCLLFSGEILLNMFSHLVFNTSGHRDGEFRCLHPIALSHPFLHLLLKPFCPRRPACTLPFIVSVTYRL